MDNPTFDFNLHSINKHGQQILPGMNVTWYSRRYKAIITGFVHSVSVRQRRKYDYETFKYSEPWFELRYGINAKYHNGYGTRISMSVKNLDPIVKE